MSKPVFREISTFRMRRQGQKKAETNLASLWLEKREALCVVPGVNAERGGGLWGGGGPGGQECGLFTWRKC